jgi:hypothetical protein
MATNDAVRSPAARMRLPHQRQWSPSSPTCCARPSTPDLAPCSPTTTSLPRLQGSNEGVHSDPAPASSALRAPRQPSPLGNPPPPRHHRPQLRPSQLCAVTTGNFALASSAPSPPPNPAAPRLQIPLRL